MRSLLLPFIFAFSAALATYGMEGQTFYLFYENQPFGKYRHHDGKREIKLFKSHNGDNIIHFLSRKGDVEGVKKLLLYSEFDCLILALNYAHEAPIHVAANYEIKRLLMEKAPKIETIEVTKPLHIDLKKIKQNREMARWCSNESQNEEQSCIKK